VSEPPHQTLDYSFYTAKVNTAATRQRTSQRTRENCSGVITVLAGDQGALAGEEKRRSRRRGRRGR